jgi:hypothetical protein
MTDNISPFTEQDQFNHSLSGNFGEMGSGGGLRILFVQSALRVQELDLVKLISTIPGSEMWPVRDLFQREVDRNRVRDKIVPYLRDIDSVKFFNPLTLVSLPLQATGVIERELPEVEIKAPGFTEDWSFQTESVSLTKEGRFAMLKWDSGRSNLVAVDGQHRLAALKELWASGQEGKDAISGWIIPVVVIVPVVEKGKGSEIQLLEVIRKIFSNINKEAEDVTKARELLLDDSSPIAMATQAILDHFHKNDTRPRGEIDLDLPPLYLFNWRGREGVDPARDSNHFLFDIVELSEWLEQYILCGDFSNEQRDALGLDAIHPLAADFDKGRVAPGNIREMRELLADDIVPAMANTLSQLAPIVNATRSSRAYEAECSEASEAAANHAFYRLRFGVYSEEMQEAGPGLREEADQFHAGFVQLYGDSIAPAIPKILRLRIGMRGLLCAYADIRRIYCAWCSPEDASWQKYSEWFVSVVNSLDEQGFFATIGEESPSDLGRKVIAATRHLSYDHNDTVGESLYRHEGIFKGIGPFFSLSLMKAGCSSLPFDPPAEELEEWCEDRLGSLATPLAAGFRKEVRPALKEKLEGEGKTRREVNQAIKKDAEKRASAQIKKIRDLLATLSG